MMRKDLLLIPVLSLVLLVGSKSQSPSKTPSDKVDQAVSAILIDYCKKVPMHQGEGAGRSPEKVPPEIAKIVEDYKSQGRTNHLCYLIEYGLNVYLKNLEQSQLARELPVEENPLLAELVRMTKIQKYKTAHEAGWLNNQFYGKFERTGYSSYQIYIWCLERDLFAGHSHVSKCPNFERICEIDKKITKTGKQAVGGGRVCHYGCL